jgi:hypothetical protein
MPITQEQVNKDKIITVDKAPFQKRVNNLKVEYNKYVPAWKDLSIWQNPTRGIFNSIPNNGSKIDHNTLIDSFARRCIRDFAAGMMSGLTSPARPWFKLGLEDQDLSKYEPVKLYLDDCQNRMRAAFSRSNIYECLYMLYEELATFGTGAMFLMEDFQDIIRGRSYTVGEYMLGTGSDCRVNTFAREYYMTVAQMVGEFGLESCSDDVKRAFKSHDTEKWIKNVHLIEENDKRIAEYKDWENMPYRSIYFEDGSRPDKYLRMEGYEEFPILAPRWALTTTADIYGKSAGWDTLGDVKMLQKEQRDKLLGIAKSVNPPMQADASVQNVNTLPGGLTRSSSLLPNVGIKTAYQVALDLNSVSMDIQEIKKALSDAYYRDLFKGILDIDRTGVSATEIAEKKAEQLNLASPLILRITNEVGNKLISRSYAIMNRMDALPLPPKEIQGMEIKIQYIGVLAQAQKMIGISAIDQWVDGVYTDAKLDASALDVLDVDAKNTEKADMLGVPAKIVASPEKMAVKRKARAQAQAQAAQAQQQAMMAEMASKASGAVKNMGQTPVGQGSALDKITSKMEEIQGNK